MFSRDYLYRGGIAGVAIAVNRHYRGSLGRYRLFDLSWIYCHTIWHHINKDRLHPGPGKGIRRGDEGIRCSDKVAGKPQRLLRRHQSNSGVAE